MKDEGGRQKGQTYDPLSTVKKAARMDAFVAGLGADAASPLDPCYQGYFRCFNAGDYYEAHDVLEHLWLKDGPAAANYAFYTRADPGGRGVRASAQAV